MGTARARTEEQKRHYHDEKEDEAEVRDELNTDTDHHRERKHEDRAPQLDRRLLLEGGRQVEELLHSPCTRTHARHAHARTHDDATAVSAKRGPPPPSA